MAHQQKLYFGGIDAN